MPLTLPDLDDRRFDDLMAEALAMIPARAPGWTDFNPSDPGITLIELFAWLNETLMYRLNRVTPANTRAFLKLLNGVAPALGADLAAEVRTTVTEMRRCDRAVSAEDFTTLTLRADPRVARAHAVARRNLAADPSADAPAHVSVVVIPTGGGAPPAALLAAVAAYLEPRRLITTRLHVAAPRLVPVGVNLTLNLTADALGPVVRAAAVATLTGYLDPLTGGDAGTGWPFGRAVYVSEIYRLLATLPGVDYVSPTSGVNELATPDFTRPMLNAAGELVGIALQPDELPAAAIDPNGIVTLSPPGPKVFAAAPVGPLAQDRAGAPSMVTVAPMETTATRTSPAMTS